MNRKRKCETDVQKLHGIVTTGDRWVFLRLEDNNVEVNDKSVFLHLSSQETDEEKDNLRSDLKLLFRLILGVYQQARVRNSGSKRVKVGL